MCKLAIVIKTKDADTPTLERALVANWPKIASEPDGIGGATFGEENHVFRDMDDYAGVFGKFLDELPGASVGVLHTRFATVGATTLENVHCYTHNGLVFAHNGHVGEYGKRAEGSMSTTSTTGAWLPKQGGTIVPNNPIITKLEDEKELSGALANGRWYSAPNKSLKVRRKHVLILVKQYKDTIDTCVLCKSVDEPCNSHYDESIMLDEMAELLRDGDNCGLFLADQGNAPVKAKEIVQTKSDSLLFLEALEDVSIAGIEAHVKKTKFSGIGALVDTNTKTLYLIGTREFDVQEGDGWMAIYSFLPEKKYTKLRYRFGLPLPGDEESIETVDMSEGVYAVKYGEIKE